ncbi:MAG: penicillin-binding protein 2 [Flavobacteriales bacterium]|nr:penicillin-binding protein 2 [Flavobacteriales bacterium]
MDFGNRKYILIFMIVSVLVIFVIRLFYMQARDESWKDRAIRITEKAVVLKPPRGLVYDRNGELLIANQAVYDLMVIPSDIESLDTVSFCNLVSITPEDFIQRMAAIRKAGGSWKAHEFMGQIKPSDYARISEHLHEFSGFFGQPSTMRRYPEGVAPLFCGMVGKVSQKDLDSDEYYDPRDYIGLGGIELAYESELRGTKGIRYFFRDHKGVTMEVAEGRLDSSAIAGEDLYSTLDIDLQEYGELLMQNKKGCIIALEPATGEILAFVSAPGYDPNLLVGRERGANYQKLVQDSLKPLYNRGVQGLYRPGSIWKMVQSLVALQNGFVQPSTRIACNRSIIGCHGPHSYDDLTGAIQHSCNPYFREVMKRMVEQRKLSNRFEDAAQGLDSWRNNIMAFGFGSDLGTDIPGTKTGQVPGKTYYDKIYGESRWAYSTIYSIAIGEGELLITPLQMANLAAIIANRGWYIPPHMVRKIGNSGSKLPEYLEKRETGVDAEHFQVVIDAMQRVVEVDGGTARRARIPGIEVCGKTGTVQNGDLPDHSVFIAFAPKNDPKIAVAVYVEYAGSGGSWAAPINSLMIEKYLNDSISDPKKEERILTASFLEH